MGRLIDLHNEVNTLTESLKKLSSDLSLNKEILSKLAEEAKKADVIFRQANKTRVETSELIKKTANNAKQLTEAEKVQQNIQKQIAKTANENLAVNTKQAKALAILKSARQDLNKQQKESITLQKSELNSIAALTVKNAQLTRERNKLSTATEAGRKRIAEINTTLDKNNAIIKQNSSALEKQKGNIGNYKSALNGLGGAIKSQIATYAAWGVGISLSIKAIKDAIKTIANFEQETTNLASILGKTRSEIAPLINSAKQLGATTAKSSSEVVKLQQAYARLGFVQDDIIKLTKGTIDGSIALNAELEATANLTGVVVKSFDKLGTADAGQILDTLTLSTQTTALSFEKLNTAIPIVAGAADAAGVSFETMVAQLGAAADRGIDASTSARALKNIYLELANKGITLDEALQKINTSQDKLTTANDLFGKIASVTALALASNAEKTGELTKAFENAGGTAEKVAKQQLDTLQGSVTLLKSAWEGLILGVKQTGALRNIVDGLTRVVSALTSKTSELNAETDVYSQLAGKEARQIDILFNSAKSENLSKEAKAELINEINTKYSSYLPNLLSEKSTIEEIEIAQNAVNKAFQTKIIQQAFQEEITNLLKEELLLKANIATAEIEQEKAKQEQIGLVTDQRQSELEAIKNISEQSKGLSAILIENNKTEVEDTREKFKRIADSYKIAFEEIESALNSNTQTVIENNTEEETSTRERISLEQIKRKELEQTAEETIKLSDAELSRTEKNVQNTLYEIGLANDYLLAYKERNLAILEDETLTQEAKAELLNESSITYLEDLIAQDELILEQEQLTADEKLAIQKNLTDKKIELEGLETKVVEDEQKKRIQAAQRATAAISQIGQGLFDFKSQLLRNEEVRIQNQVERGVISEEEGAKQIAEIKKKQAQTNKNNAIFSAVINTASGITGALSALPGPAGIALAVIVGILGALQIAAIASEPIPEFATGVTDFKGGKAKFAEKGREIIELPDGSSYLATEPTIGYLPKGTNVIPNWETEKRLQGGGQSSDPGKDVVIQNNIVTYSSNITPRGFEYAQQSGSTRVIYENKYFKK